MKILKGLLYGSLGFLVLTILIVALAKADAPAAEVAPRAVVYNSEWDASVAQVKAYLKAHLNDPGSVEYVEWSPVVELPDGGFLVRCKFRARNAYGGMVLAEKSFRMDAEGAVVSVADYAR